MARWTCPNCDREFGRAHQSHVCVPGGTVEETFTGRPPAQIAAYEAIMAHLATLGPVHTDSVKVGVFLKTDRKFAEIRPMARALAVYMRLPYKLDHPRVTRVMDREWVGIRLQGPDEVDDELRAWLTDAYDHATD